MLPRDISRNDRGQWFARVGMDFFWGSREECEAFLRDNRELAPGEHLP